MPNRFLALLGALALAAPLSAQMIVPGKTLSWTSSNSQMGTLRISNVNGQYFEAEQTNERNRSAGVVRLYGAILDNGHRVVLINAGQWKEVWEGSMSDREINGTLNTGSTHLTFRVVDGMPAMASNHPFTEGKLMRWTAGSGQGGSMRVLFSSGHRFMLEQKNDFNPSAGLVKFEGEFRDGRIILLNKQYNETWEGSYTNGRVTGKINRRTDFAIFD